MSQISKIFVIIQSISDHKFIGDFKPNIMWSIIIAQRSSFSQKTSHSHRFGLIFGQSGQKSLHSSTRINDIFHNENIFALQNGQIVHSNDLNVAGWPVKNKKGCVSVVIKVALNKKVCKIGDYWGFFVLWSRKEASKVDKFLNVFEFSRAFFEIFRDLSTNKIKTNI